MAKKAESGGYARLKGDLAQKTPGSFYVLYGEEDYLRRYYLSMLRRQLVDGPTEDFNFHRLTSENFSMQVLSESLEALPMMAERTMIQVDDVDLFALPEDDRTQLAALFSDIQDYACLVLVYADFKPDKRKKKLWDAMEKNAVLAEFAYQTERDLTAWIVRHFRAEKKNISPALCGYLLQRCGSSMTRLDAEIAKICAYSGADDIVRADIDAVVEPTLEAVVFEITDALGQREFDRALERLSVCSSCAPSPSPCSARSAAICAGSTPHASCRRPGRPRRTLPRSAASRRLRPTSALRRRGGCRTASVRRPCCCAARPTGR